MWFQVVIVCSCVCISRADNIQKIHANIYNDNGDLKCKSYAPEVVINEPFQVYVNSTENKYLVIYGGSCYKTSDPIKPIEKYFWQKPLNKEPGYISGEICPLTESGSESYTCNVFTRPCNLPADNADSTYDCWYTINSRSYHDKGIKCNFVINVVGRKEKEIEEKVSKENLIPLVLAYVVALILVSGWVWTIIHLMNVLKRTRRRSNSLHVYECSHSHNAGNTTVPSQWSSRNTDSNSAPAPANIEDMYLKPIPKYLRKPKVPHSSQVANLQLEESPYASVQYVDSKILITESKDLKPKEPVYAVVRDGWKYQNNNAQNSEVIYNNLFHA